MKNITPSISSPFKTSKEGFIDLNGSIESLRETMLKKTQDQKFNKAFEDSILKFFKSNPTQALSMNAICNLCFAATKLSVDDKPFYYEQIIKVTSELAEKSVLKVTETSITLA